LDNNVKKSIGANRCENILFIRAGGGITSSGMSAPMTDIYSGDIIPLGYGNL
jgi:hypothetical protein